MKAYSIPQLHCSGCGFPMTHVLTPGKWQQRLIQETQMVVVTCWHPNCNEYERKYQVQVCQHELKPVVVR